jgi:hypothetical protein
MALAERTGHALYVLGHLTALGTAQLSLEQPAAAAGSLLRAWEIAYQGGIASAARFPVLAEAVEALVMIGDVDGAAKLACEHQRIAQSLARPWVLALAARCGALVAVARGQDSAAVSGSVSMSACQ